MQKKTLFARCAQRMCLLCVFLIFNSTVFGQLAHFWSVFGTGGCHDNNDMPCNAAATTTGTNAFSGISDLDDLSGMYGGYKNFRNSAYDGAGHLLFSVNADGIYSPSGYQFFDFTYSASTFTGTYSSVSYTLTPGWAVSEISIFPFPGKQNSYYVLFWAHDTHYEEDHIYELRAIEVDISNDPTLSDPTTGVPGDFAFTCIDHIMLDNVAGPDNLGGTLSGDAFPYQFVLAVDAPNSDCTRDVYSLEPINDGSNRSLMRKWEIAANGALPTTAYTYHDHRSDEHYQANAYSPKGKILTIGGVKYFSYICGTTGESSSDGIPRFGWRLQMFTLMDTYGGASSIYESTTTSFYPSLESLFSTTSTPPSSEVPAIFGFEYVPSSNVIYFSYANCSYPPSSGSTLSPAGLGYWDASGGIHLSTTTSDYSYTDLELDNYGDLFMVKGDLGSEGNLAYLPVGFIPTTTIVPTQVTTTCTSDANIHSDNNIPTGLTSRPSGYYLCSQIRGEDYGSWGTELRATYKVTGAEVWTSSSNPVTNVTGIPTTTIRSNNIEIEAGGSLTINGMTVQINADDQIDIDNSTVTGTNGGRLTLTNATLTRFSGNCEGTGGMWGGVRVWGSAAATQTPLATTSQGYLLIDGAASNISYAKTAVALGNSTPGTGGGIIQAINCAFHNNNIGVFFAPYANFNPSTHAEINNFSSFRNCAFDNNDPSTLLSPTLYHIEGSGVKGVSIGGSTFTHSLGSSYTTYGIYGSNMGFNVLGIFTSPFASPVRNAFSNFTCAIHHDGIDASHTASIAYSDFSNNVIGVDLNNSISPIVTQCTFSIPVVARLTTSRPYSTIIQSIGLNLQGTMNYNVHSNSFQINPGSISTSPSSNKTVGVLADNTVLAVAEELINNNNYKGLGAANLSNYKNYDDLTGLWYKCNTNTNNVFDISTMGADYLAGGDGIRYLQGLNASTSYAGHIYGSGSTAGNTFSVGSSYTNLSASNVIPITYLYSNATGASILDQPGTSSTGIVTYTPGSGITVTPLTIADQCALPGSVTSTTTSSSTTAIPAAHHRPAVIDPNNNPVDAYMAVKYNVNYYMGDSDGVNHRDSLYYWVGQLNSGAGELTKAYLLLEDGYADSATAVYDSINIKYPMDSITNIQFATLGKELFNVKKRVIGRYANINNTIANAYAASLNVDSVLHADSATLYYDVLDDATLTTLVNVFDSSKGSTHTGVESILAAYASDTLKSMLTANPDTLLFPTITEGTVLKSNPGVLAVTEISQGPSNNTGCQYAEMIVANCGSDAGDYSDVSGWIADDNSGNFDTSGSTAGNAGITRGHYRLKPDNVLWQNIKVGTVLVMYNATVNCYGLPDTMKIDSTNGIVYLPIPGTPKAYLQRYAGIENASSSSYCSDTGTTVYDTATAWATTMNLDAADGLQVRCPGCTTAAPGSPAFYQGIVYTPDGTYSMNVVPASAASPGAPLVTDASTYQKYVFTGSTLSDFANPTKWATSSADEAGNPPSSLGYVDSTLYSLVISHSLSMPCCGTGGEGMGERKANTTTTPGNNNTINKVVQGIRVYPNPASMTLNFEFPASGNVSIKLMDVTGRVLDEQVINTGTTAAFDVKGYAAGLYLYQVITAGNTQSGKFIVK